MASPVLEQQPAPHRRLTSRIGLLHVIALVSGLLAFLLIVAWMRGQQELVEVAVATDVVRAGDVVLASDFELVEVPADASFGDHLLSAEEAAGIAAEGGVATRLIGVGEPMLSSDFRTVATPEGLRAMSVPLDVSQAVGGALAPGDRVDLIGFDETGPFYIATDIAVIDVPGESGSAFGSTNQFAVTLAVDDAQALGIAAALEVDDLHVIRSTGAPEVDLERLLPEDGAPPAEDPPGDTTGDG